MQILGLRNEEWGGDEKERKKKRKRKVGGEEAAEVGVFLVQLPSFPEKKISPPR